MKVGLFFGSFNPIHVGHLIIARSALNETDLEEIWFMVSPQNPFKKKQSLLSEVDRLRMVELGVENDPQLRASNFEFFLPKPSYTIDTLTHLVEKYPRHEFSLVMGEDNLRYLHKWKNFEAIVKYYSIFAYPRQSTEPAEYPDYPNVRLFELPFLDISATRIRTMVSEGKSIRYLVPDPVLEYIAAHKLYEI